VERRFERALSGRVGHRDLGVEHPAEIDRSRQQDEQHRDNQRELDERLARRLLLIAAGTYPHSGTRLHGGRHRIVDPAT